ncbi:hypothetical protein EIN_284460 [Entamoeba invadens IP1]|uniref:Uncharacterized protein n=1 Tax=Entamoeba invadens IP1 TaxID=370355 RepID=L7FJZ3_ENTIV|nr:hypothetical protein EIN_284460 [Entamoeba invadens IP1]ELP84870.1 hypothetical protein EIN_284460 [Entamoeba invadens IP1]|eukprot:XP_004184216.1 hypothetical protein EIN_284460 [Entamoeba invadens IP1]
MAERRVSKEIQDFCNLLVGTWKLNQRVFGFEKNFPEKNAKNLVIDIASDDVLTNECHRFYRWTTTNDVEMPEKNVTYPTMVMEVYARSEAEEYDFAFHSDDFIENGSGSITGKWMKILLDYNRKDEHTTKILHYKLEDKNTILYTGLCIDNSARNSIIEQGVMHRIYLNENIELLKTK